jgi:hypothetical protein
VPEYATLVAASCKTNGWSHEGQTYPERIRAAIPSSDRSLPAGRPWT